jgi:hypothetical protein
MDAHQTAFRVVAAEALPARPAAVLWHALVESVRRHRAFIVIVLAYCIACYAAGWLTGASRLVDIKPYTGIFTVLVGFLGIVVVVSSVLHVKYVVRPEGPLYPAVKAMLFGELLTADRLANILIPFTVGPLFFSAFGSFKVLIPHMNPFGWDHTFMLWDMAIHGGHMPWRLLQPVLGTPIVTSAINVCYDLWFGAMLATYIWQAWSLDRRELRAQFLISFLLFWIVIGTVMATLLSSAGPCYYGRVTGLEDPFQPLMAYLSSANDVAPVWSLKIQDLLWQNYTGDGSLPAGGISAMPSMHLAIATLMALLGWRTNRWLGAGYTAFAAIILIGSVHLGWHYAIDGYVSIVVAIVLWYGTGWALRRSARAAAARPAGQPAPARSL